VALTDLLPNLTDQNVALDVALRAIRKGREEAPALTDRLITTAVGKGSEVYYRPYAAARLWLAAHPRWLTEGEGAKWRDLDHALSSLAEEQAMLDGALGLSIPLHLQTASPGSAPGPAFSSWR